MYHWSDPEAIAECQAWCPVAQAPFIQDGERFTKFTIRASAHESPEVFRSAAGPITVQSDVAREQLSQGRIRYISCQARLAALCFKVLEDGTITVAQANDTLVVGQELHREGTRGNVALRGLNPMCDKAQQALLDSHRAGISQHTAQNLIEDTL